MRRIRTTDDVEPLLHFVLVLELCVFACARCGKELVQVELVKLATTSDGQKLFGHLIGQQPHFGQCTVRIPCTRMLLRKLLLRTLLIGIRPIEDLLFDELAAVESPEWRTRHVKVCSSLNRQEVLFIFRQFAKLFVQDCKALVVL